MSAESIALAKQIIGYKRGVTYELGDWLAATLANCESVLAKTTARAKVQREALALALSTTAEVTWVPHEMAAGALKKYKTLRAAYPDAINAVRNIYVNEENDDLPMIDELLYPEFYPGARFDKAGAMRDLKEFRRYVQKHQAQLNEVQVKLTSLRGDNAGDAIAEGQFILGNAKIKFSTK